jgi:H+-transporting ATPase
MAQSDTRVTDGPRRIDPATAAGAPTESPLQQVPAGQTGFEHLSIEAALRTLDVDPAKGLSEAEAANRLERYGPNAIEEKRISPLQKFLSFFWGPIPWMIEIAAILSAVVQHWEDFTIIGVMLLINASVGFFEEHKADNAIAALKRSLALEARVLRDGVWKTIEARELAPGDILMLHLGNIIPGDVKLIDGEYLSVDQSALTGESLPVDKAVGDIAYASSIAKMGEMTAVVTATGGETYFGRTAKLVESAGAVSHFQKAVLRIGNFLILSTLGLVALILMIALFRHDPVVETILFALILTVAAIPVALPAVLSVTMAVGAVKLARMKAIVSRLVSIEEMAGMDILCSDKTGTLTKNQLAVGEPDVVEAKDADELLLCAALASRIDAEDDPIDGAIAKALGDPGKLEGYRTLRFEPFDPVRKQADAEIEADGARFEVAKGAPQVILDLTGPSDIVRRGIDSEVDALAGRGYRTLGVARTEPGGRWRFLGLVPLFDPPRDDSVDTIERTKSMGLDMRMVTGDHVAIARETARTLHLGANIVAANEIFDADGRGHDGERIEAAEGFAQVFPEHKFKIVKELQARGHIVGMTGDGVNDAPALKQADIGIAVSGATDAARAAADLVLTAPGLSVITRAIEEARQIFERMTSYAVYRIAETVRVLLFMTLSIVAFNFYPVTAIMIVLLAILNDFPIMMIAYDNAPVAERPVRWDMHRVLTLSLTLGVMGVISSFSLFWVAEEYLHIPRETIRTLVFLKLLVAGHMTIFLTRNVGAFWDRPWPSWKLIVAAETTQVVGTLAAVYGWLVPPIGWQYALAIWGYATLWFLINNVVKVEVYRLTEHRGGRQVRHLRRVQTRLHPDGRVRGSRNRPLARGHGVPHADRCDPG